MLKGELNFVIIGAKSTGKTWYIKNLVSRKEISAVGENTVNYIEAVSETDEATNISYTELYFNYKDSNFNVEFQMDDYDGNFVETWHDNSSNKVYKEKLTHYVKESEGIFIFLEYSNSNDDKKFKNMEKEIDVFIETIKKEYGEEHSELPIPVIFVVSKWDKSPDFKSEDEVKKAEEYIHSNPYLSNIKEKVLNHFAYGETIPLSSLKDYNMIAPIQKCLNITFQSWEEKIKELQESSDKIIYLDYLSEKVYDLRFYKDGKYKKMYDEIEKEFADEYIPQILNKTTIKKFNEFYKENAIIFESLKEENREKIETHKNSLEKKHKTKKIVSGVVIAGILSVGGFKYKEYSFSQAEKQAFNNINIEYSHKNYAQALNDIKNYYSVYNMENKQHLSALKTTQEEIREKFRDKIEKELKSLESIKSLLKAYTKIEKLNNDVKAMAMTGKLAKKIQKLFTQFQQLKADYIQVSNKINTLSLENISKDAIDSIYTNLNNFKSFDEYNELNNQLQQKFQSIKSVLVTQNDIDEDKITEMIDLASTLGLSDDDIRNLNDKLEQLKIQNQFKEFMKHLENINEDNIAEMITYISNNWDYQNYTDRQKQKTREYINEKFNTFVNSALHDTPDKIDNIENYNHIFETLKKIDALNKNIKQLPIDDNSPYEIDIQNKINKKQSLDSQYYKVLTNGVDTSSLTFYAKKGNKLGVDSLDDELEIWNSNRRLYKRYDAFRNGHVTFYSNITYKVGKYNFTVIEKDIVNDDKLPIHFSLSKNQLITLYNTGRLSIPLGDGDVYAIELGK